jgi:hypothetical protein
MLHILNENALKFERKLYSTLKKNMSDYDAFMLKAKLKKYELVPVLRDLDPTVCRNMVVKDKSTMNLLEPNYPYFLETNI